jgi:DNA polymerase III sliding clamp (beta) subunit (PCNA family)
VAKDTQEILDRAKAQREVFTALKKYDPAYKGWSESEIAEDFGKVYSSGDTAELSKIISNLHKSDPAYKGWGLDEVTNELNYIFGKVQPEKTVQESIPETQRSITTTNIPAVKSLNQIQIPFFEPEKGIPEKPKEFYRENFNTKLTPEEEKKFQSWIQEGIQKYGIDLSDDLDVYDLRGYWKSGGDKDEAFRQRKGHAPDTFKKPNHPTFSEESIYSGKADKSGIVYQGGKWEGEKFIPSEKQKETTKSRAIPEGFLQPALRSTTRVGEVKPEIPPTPEELERQKLGYQMLGAAETQFPTAYPVTAEERLKREITDIINAKKVYPEVADKMTDFQFAAWLKENVPPFNQRKDSFSEILSQPPPVFRSLAMKLPKGILRNAALTIAGQLELSPQAIIGGMEAGGKELEKAYKVVKKEGISGVPEALTRTATGIAHGGFGTALGTSPQGAIFLQSQKAIEETTPQASPIMEAVFAPATTLAGGKKEGLEGALNELADVAASVLIFAGFHKLGKNVSNKIKSGIELSDIERERLAELNENLLKEIDETYKKYNVSESLKSLEEKGRELKIDTKKLNEELKNQKEIISNTELPKELRDEAQRKAKLIENILSKPEYKEQVKKQVLPKPIVEGVYPRFDAEGNISGYSVKAPNGEFIINPENGSEIFISIDDALRVQRALKRIQEPTNYADILNDLELIGYDTKYLVNLTEKEGRNLWRKEARLPEIKEEEIPKPEVKAVEPEIPKPEVKAVEPEIPKPEVKEAETKPILIEGERAKGITEGGADPNITHEQIIKSEGNKSQLAVDAGSNATYEQAKERLDRYEEIYSKMKGAKTKKELNELRDELLNAQYLREYVEGFVGKNKWGKWRVYGSAEKDLQQLKNDLESLKGKVGEKPEILEQNWRRVKSKDIQTKYQTLVKKSDKNFVEIEYDRNNENWAIYINRKKIGEEPVRSFNTAKEAKKWVDENVFKNVKTEEGLTEVSKPEVKAVEPEVPKPEVKEVEKKTGFVPLKEGGMTAENVNEGAKMSFDEASETLKKYIETEKSLKEEFEKLKEEYEKTGERNPRLKEIGLEMQKNQSNREKVEGFIAKNKDVPYKSYGSKPEQIEALKNDLNSLKKEVPKVSSGVNKGDEFYIEEPRYYNKALGKYSTPFDFPEKEEGYSFRVKDVKGNEVILEPLSDDGKPIEVEVGNELVKEVKVDKSLLENKFIPKLKIPEGERKVDKYKVFKFEVKKYKNFDEREKTFEDLKEGTYYGVISRTYNDGKVDLKLINKYGEPIKVENNNLRTISGVRTNVNVVEKFYEPYNIKFKQYDLEIEKSEKPKVRKTKQKEDYFIHQNITKKKMPIPELNLVMVKDGVMTSTDLDTYIKTKTNLPDGVYRIYGKDFVKQKDVNLADMPSERKLDTETKKVTFSINLDDIFREFLKVLSKDENRESFRGIGIRIEGNKLTVGSTDGKVMFIREFTLNNKVQDFSAILPENFVRIFLSDNFSGDTKFEFTKGFMGDDLTTEIRLMRGDAEYKCIYDYDPPKYNSLYPEGKLHTLLFNKKQLLDAINELEPYLDKYRIISLEKTKGEIKLSSINEKEGSLKSVTVGADYLGEKGLEGKEFRLLMPSNPKGLELKKFEDSDYSIALNIDYLKKVLNSLESDKVFFQNNSNKSSVLFRDYVVKEGTEPKYKGESNIETYAPIGRGIPITSQYQGYGLPIESKVNPEIKNSDLRDPQRLSDISKSLSSSLEFEAGKNLRFGLLKRFGRALGIFFRDSGIIRIRNLEDLDVLSHEIGHWIDIDVLGLTDKIKFKKGDQVEQLITMQLGRYKKDPQKRLAYINKLRNQYGADVVDSIVDRIELRAELKGLLEKENFPNRKKFEGVAEFVRNYVLKPDFVEKECPKFYNFFESLISHNENLQKALLDARKKYKNWSETDTFQKFASKLHYKDDEKKSTLSGIKNLFGSKGIVYNVVNALAPIKKLDRELREKKLIIRGSESPLNRVLSILGAEGKLKQFMENAPFRELPNGEIELRKDVKPFLQIISRVIKDNTIVEHDCYLVAKRNNELIGRGLIEAAKFQPKENNEIIERFESKYGKEYGEKLSEELEKFTDSVLEYYRDAGMISTETLNTIKEKYKFYVPFKAFFDELEGRETRENLSKKLTTYIPQPLKSLKGTTRGIYSPIESIIDNTLDFILAADRNKAQISIINSLRKIDKSNIQEIPMRKMKLVHVIDPDTKEIVKRWSPQFEVEKGKQVITVLEGGERHAYQIPIEFYDAIYNMTESYSKALKMFAFPTTILRAGAVVYDPTFGFRNITRDQISAFFYSKYGYNPYHFIKGVMSSIKKDETYQKFLASGADLSFLAVADKTISSKRYKSYVESNFNKLFKRYGGWDAMLKIAEDFNRATELGTRVGAFKNAFEKTGDSFESMAEARRIAGDYSIRGASMRNISPLYAFFNARMRHAENIAESFKKENIGKTFVRGITTIVPAQMIIWAINNMDEDRKKLYQELPAWRKNFFFNIPIPMTNSFLPIPKGFYGTLFGSTLESALNWSMNNDKEQMKELPKQIISELSPISGWSEFVPTALRPIVEQFANKIGYTGQNIVPKGTEKLPPEEQYSENTTEFIKEIGKYIGVSPARIEAFITGYTAGTGKNVLYLTDEILQQIGLVERKPEDKFTVLSRLPISRAFVSQPPLGLSSKSVQQFFEKLDELEGLNNLINQAIEKLDSNEAMKLLESKKGRIEDYQWYLKNQTQINRFREIIRGHREFLTEILADPNEQNKEDKIIEIKSIITNIAQDFLEAYNNKEKFVIDKSLNFIKEDIKRREKTQRREVSKFKRNIKKY